MYLSGLEFGQYSSYFGIETHEIKQELEYMKSQGLFRLQYLLILEKLRSLCIIAKGNPNHVCSLSRAFLKHTPTSRVMIGNGGTISYIITRVPEDIAHPLLTTLPSIAADNGISIKASPISAYAGFRNNLYQRLLLDDGSWDEDVSGLLDQMRLRSINDED